MKNELKEVSMLCAKSQPFMFVWAWQMCTWTLISVRRTLPGITSHNTSTRVRWHWYHAAVVHELITLLPSQSSRTEHQNTSGYTASACSRNGNKRIHCHQHWNDHMRVDRVSALITEMAISESIVTITERSCKSQLPPTHFIYMQTKTTGYHKDLHYHTRKVLSSFVHTPITQLIWRDLRAMPRPMPFFWIKCV